MAKLADSLVFLWRRRFRPVGVVQTAKWTAKRLWHLVPIVKLLTYNLLLEQRGARIGRMVNCLELKLNGPEKNLEIGEFCSIGAATIATHARVSIGDRVIINDGVRILTGSHSLTDPGFGLVTRSIAIGDYAWICTGAIILPGVCVGRGAVVGAGAVVSKSVPDYAIVVGNPARVVGSNRSRVLCYAPSILTAAFEAWISKQQVAKI